MFPPKQLNTMVTMTNQRLIRRLRQPKGELMKLFGLLILCTCFEFGSRGSLLSNKKPGKHVPAPAFGTCGMSRDRFDVLWSLIRFGEKPEERPSTMSSDEYRWRLVDDFVENFNAYRVSIFTPSDLICVDESMSKRYGNGGHWINLGLPQCIAIDRKPENGCEIQNSACGRSYIFMRLELVKTAEREETHLHTNETGLPRGLVVLRFLVYPWGRSFRIVCADFYFASVIAAENLVKMGLRLSLSGA